MKLTCTRGDFTIDRPIDKSKSPLAHLIVMKLKIDTSKVKGMDGCEVLKVIDKHFKALYAELGITP